jgi:hypothetical protein
MDTNYTTTNLDGLFIVTTNYCKQAEKTDVCCRGAAPEPVTRFVREMSANDFQFAPNRFHDESEL